MSHGAMTEFRLVSFDLACRLDDLAAAAAERGLRFEPGHGLRMELHQPEGDRLDLAVVEIPVELVDDECGSLFLVQLDGQAYGVSLPSAAVAIAFAYGGPVSDGQDVTIYETLLDPLRLACLHVLRDGVVTAWNGKPGGEAPPTPAYMQ